MHRRVLPAIGLPRRDRFAKTLAPVGPQGPPARRAARLVAVATRARGSLLWTTGTSCAGARNSRSCNQLTACHNRILSRQSSGTKHLRRDDKDGFAAFDCRFRSLGVDLYENDVLKRLVGSSIRGCLCLPRDAWPKGRRGLYGCLSLALRSWYQR